MTCCVGEEDKLAREGSEKRRIMGLRRGVSYFHSSSRYIAERLPRQGKKRGGETEKGMIVRLLPYMHTHTHTHTRRGGILPHMDTQRHTHTHISERKNKVFIQFGCETQQHCDGLFV